jgi:hypothetical protein
MADLKEKCAELETALNERDAYINELEEIKEYLIREIEDLQSRKEGVVPQENFQINLESVEESKKQDAELFAEQNEVE